MSKFQNTAKALIEYDADEPRREDLWSPESIQCDSDVFVAEAAEAEALRKLQDAFYEDTKSFNTLAGCHSVCDIAFFRRLAATDSD